MITNNNSTYIVGFDDGYQLSKSTNYIWENGVSSMGSVEPTIIENSLYYDGNYYKLGEGRTSLTEDKLSDENARLRTMVAIAKELSRAGAYNADIVLAVGLPFSNFGRDKKKLVDYYMEKPKLEFKYEGKEYDVTIKRVIVCPQCFAAIAPRLRNMTGTDYLVIDIGSKTTDVVYVRDGMPLETKSITLEKAMVKFIREIQSNVQIQLGKDLPENEIMKVILGKTHFLPDTYVQIIRQTLQTQIEELELELAERGYNLEFLKCIYIGGGAQIAKDYSAHRGNVAFDEDIRANAIGYEFLAKSILESGR